MACNPPLSGKVFRNSPSGAAIFSGAARLLAAVTALSSLLFWSGCQAESSYSLQVEFPSQELLQKTAKLYIWVVRVKSCQQVAWEELSAGNMEAAASLVISHPASDPIAGSLAQVPDGFFAFTAEGRMESGARILRACTPAEVKSGTTVQVKLELECVCEPVPGVCAPLEEIVGNGRDDDCDGKTDECRSETDCNDENGCTQDLCVAEQCQHPRWPDTTRCSDGDPCTRDDSCHEGVCRGSPKDCSAYDSQCTRGQCNPLTGQCEPEPLPDGTPCDDGLFCSDPDSCTAGLCGGPERDCSDQDPCTRDACDEAAQACQHTVDPSLGTPEGPVGDASCSNGSDDDCDGLTDQDDTDCSLCSSDADCDDGNSCTRDSCISGQCSNDPAPLEGTTCDDGLYCTEPDACTAGTCTGPERDCSALDDSCHRGYCNEASSACEALPKPPGTACDDGLYCTDPDSCQEGTCTGPDRDCDDGDACTRDTCNEESDTCEHVLQPLPGAEGPADEATCGNGLDDDCDGLTDGDDPDCTFHYALRFDGVDDFVSASQDTSLLSQQHLGVFLDFSTGDSLRNWAVVASHSGFSADVENNRWLLGFDIYYQRSLLFEVSNGTQVFSFAGLVPQASCFNTRFQILAAVDATTGTVRVFRYHDGSETMLLDDSSFVGPINTDNLIFDMIIGGVKTGSYDETLFTGMIRQVAVFNYSDFSPQDRQLLFVEFWKLKDYVRNGTDHGFSFARSDVIDCFDFDVGSGTTLPNLCDNNNGDGTLVHFPGDDSQWIRE